MLTDNNTNKQQMNRDNEHRRQLTAGKTDKQGGDKQNSGDSDMATTNGGKLLMGVSIIHSVWFLFQLDCRRMQGHPTLRVMQN